MIASLLINHFRLVGLPVKPVTLWRISGVAMILLGLAITQLASPPQRLPPQSSKSMLSS